MPEIVYCYALNARRHNGQHIRRSLKKRGHTFPSLNCVKNTIFSNLQFWVQTSNQAQCTIVFEVFKIIIHPFFSELV